MEGRASGLYVCGRLDFVVQVSRLLLTRNIANVFTVPRSISCIVGKSFRRPFGALMFRLAALAYHGNLRLLGLCDSVMIMRSQGYLISKYLLLSLILTH
jgi:hypothetical protein